MSSNKNLREVEYKLIIKEFIEAWNHFRHLERNRNVYVSFLMTIFLAIFGFTLKLFQDQGEIANIFFISGIWGLFYILDIISTVIYIYVKKTGYSLLHYRNVIQRSRDFVYKNPVTMGKLFWVGDRKKPIVGTTLSIQGATEKLVGLFVLSINIFLLSIIFYLLLIFNLQDSWIVFILAFLFLALIYLQILVFKDVRKANSIDETKNIFYLEKK